MSYWGSHFTSLRDQKEEDDMDEESDPDKELVRYGFSYQWKEYQHATDMTKVCGHLVSIKLDKSITRIRIP